MQSFRLYDHSKNLIPKSSSPVIKVLCNHEFLTNDIIVSITSQQFRYGKFTKKYFTISNKY